jgi:hypothetical protein
LVANDVLEVFSFIAFTVANTYTQSQVDGLLADYAGLRLLVPTSATNGTVGATGAVTFSGVSSVSLNGCFSSTYENYLLRINGTGSLTTETDLAFRFRTSGSDNSTSNYFRWAYNRTNAGAGNGYTASANTGYIGSCASGGFSAAADIFQPQISANTMLNSIGHGYGSSSSNAYWFQNQFATTTSFDGITIYPSSGTITGTIRVYGYKN